MKTRACTALVGVATTIAVVARMPQRSHAQPGGGGGGSGGDAPGEKSVDSATSDCATDGSGAHYNEFVNGEGLTTVRWAGSLTGCPNHVNWPLNPNPAGEIVTNASIPAYPMLFEKSGTTDLSQAAGVIGILRNGVAMYSSWAVNQVVDYETTAFYLEADSFDPCGGHATASGSYHYHGTAGCLQEQAGGVVGEHSPLIGWAYDGFPFYGQLGPGGVEMKMCGADGADATVCLDACSGFEALIDEDDFAYRYYTSCGFDESFFPFTANCYRGCCPEGVTCNDKVEACGTAPEVGYTGAYVPMASTPLDDMYDATLISGDDRNVIGSDFSVDCTLYLGAGSVSAILAQEFSPPSPTAAAATAVSDDSINASTPSPTATVTSARTAVDSGVDAGTSSRGVGSSAPSPEAGETGATSPGASSMSDDAREISATVYPSGSATGVTSEGEEDSGCSRVHGTTGLAALLGLSAAAAVLFYP